MSTLLVRYRFFLVLFLLVGGFFVCFKQKIYIFVDDLNMNSKEFQLLDIYVMD